MASKTSITELRNYLRSLDKESLESEVEKLFQKYKSVREYYEVKLYMDDKPAKNESVILKKYKAKIMNAIHPDYDWQGGFNTEAVEKAIKRFNELELSLDAYVELNLFAIQEATTIANLYGGDYGEEFYIYFQELFEHLLLKLYREGGLEKYKHEMWDIISNAFEGYGHYDTLKETYDDYYKD